MRIDYLLKKSWPTFSFEFMSPRSDAESERLFTAAEELRDLAPTFVCVTCRAGRQEQTLDLVHRMKVELGFEAMAHLVCNGADRNQVAHFLDQLQERKISNILALRGDVDPGQDPSEWRLKHATDLIDVISETPGLCIGAACYPEGHVESRDRNADLRYTKQKVLQGASFLITQLFFENSHYFDFVAAARAEGIEVPIIPGIMPITNAKQLPRVEEMGATVPAALEREIIARADDAQAVAQFGVAWASLQCTSLLAAGAPGIHFYTFNRSPATKAILGALRSAEPWKWAARDAIA
jgi:methylenetetrahydrofolate reductase (NADPH)